MTVQHLYSDPYATRCVAIVENEGPNGGILVNRSVFYPTGGGQPGDSGELSWDPGKTRILDTRKAPGDGIELILAADGPRPQVGAKVEMAMDWPRRHRHMRTHTALHLLSVVVPLPVTSGAISEAKGRLDFDMPDPITNRDQLETELNRLVSLDLRVSEDWMTDDELAANPALVKTLSVKPPAGTGRMRLIRIGAGDDQVDLQPCGGTHVRSTAEIGRIRVGKIEKKGRQNRRINIHLD